MPAKFALKTMPGANVPVMHACGHDLHMASILGHGRQIMAHSKDTWHGALMLIGQPARGDHWRRQGDASKTACLTRFPRPDVGCGPTRGQHTSRGGGGDHPWGFQHQRRLAAHSIYGKGGHGSAPHTAIDPIVIAARTFSRCRPLLRAK